MTASACIESTATVTAHKTSGNVVWGRAGARVNASTERVARSSEAWGESEAAVTLLGRTPELEVLFPETLFALLWISRISKRLLWLAEHSDERRPHRPEAAAERALENALVGLRPVDEVGGPRAGLEAVERVQVQQIGDE